MLLLLIALAGAAGTLARFGVGQLIPHSTAEAFPWATLLVNVTGTLVLAFVVRLLDGNLMREELRMVIGIGFCGAFTTFSTFSVETVRLAQSGHPMRAGLYVLTSLLLGLLATLAGFRFAAALVAPR